jgi:uncharacterized protein involved in exopolysaccharide biosynthesis
MDMPVSQNMAPARSRSDSATRDAQDFPDMDGANPWRAAADLLARKARRHLGALLLAALAGAALAGLAKAVLPTTYKASAQILIDPQENRSYGVDTSTTTLEASAAINFVESQMGVIGSERVLLRVIRDQGLAGTPPTAGPSAAEEAKESPEARRARELVENKALVALQKAVTIQRAERSFLINLTVADKSPEKAALLANALVKAYGDVNQIDRNASARGLAAELANRVQDMRRLLDESESRLLNYKIEHNLVGLHDKSITERRMAEATDALAAAENRETQARARLKQLDSASKDVGGVAAFGPDPESRQLQVLIEGRAVARAELEQIESTLGERHPALTAGRTRLRDYDRRIGQSVDGLRLSARSQLAESQSQTAALTKKLADLAGEMTRARESDVPLQQLEDALEGKRKALTALEARQRDASDMSRVEGVNFRLVSPARIPNSQGKTFGVILWSLCGGLIGAAMAMAALALMTMFEDAKVDAAPPCENPREQEKSKENAPKKVLENPWSSSPDDRCLAAMPPIGAAAGRRHVSTVEAMMEVTRRPDSPYARAVAELHGRLCVAKNGGDGPVVVLVAATAPQCGASTLAANLARAAAARGQRALLIDAHQARPALGLTIPADAPKTLIELAGRQRPLYRLAPFSQSLSLIPALAKEDRICRSIAARNAYARIVGVKGNFDFVVFDGPDSGDEAGLRALVPAVGQVVLLVPADGGDEPVLPRLLRRLGAEGQKFAGFVRAAPRRLTLAA